jgi:TRAP-type C4-dicarboxylate transport system permease small subunit
LTLLVYIQALLLRIERWIGGSCLLLLLILALAQIIARNFLSIGLPTADTLTRYLVLYVTFFGAILAIHGQRHISLDVLCVWLGQCWRDRLYRPLQFIGALVTALLCQAAWAYWQDEWAHVTDQDRWMTLLALILPVGFGLLSLHFLLAGLIGKPAVEPERP